MHSCCFQCSKYFTYNSCSNPVRLASNIPILEMWVELRGSGLSKAMWRVLSWDKIWTRDFHAPTFYYHTKPGLHGKGIMSLEYLKVVRTAVALGSSGPHCHQHTRTHHPILTPSIFSMSIPSSATSVATRISLAPPFKLERANSCCSQVVARNAM